MLSQDLTPLLCYYGSNVPVGDTAVTLEKHGLSMLFRPRAFDQRIFNGRLLSIDLFVIIYCYIYDYFLRRIKK